MTLPFTLDGFLDVFASYNRALWPAVVLLWLATCLAVVLVVRGDPRATRVTALLLAIHWAWSGIAYHLAFFSRINPAAWVFGALFLTQAGGFAWWALRDQPPHVRRQPDSWSRLGLALMAYALAYPALGLAFGLGYPRMPTFGVPCPTTLFSVGALLLWRSSAPRLLGIIPLAWTVVGGSAAWLFGVIADLALPVSGAVLFVSMMRPRRE